MKLNGLLASPSLRRVGRGRPARHRIDARRRRRPKPQAAIVSIAHLSDEERQFVVTLLLSKLVTWMRAQPGTPRAARARLHGRGVRLRAAHRATPPSKQPILTILKQARAFGVGMVLSTQNPVDLDYKAISNAGTWMIGRLQTERDKAPSARRACASAGGDADIDAIGDTIGGLGKREFLLHTTRRRCAADLRHPLGDVVSPRSAHPRPDRRADGRSATAAAHDRGAELWPRRRRPHRRRRCRRARRRRIGSGARGGRRCRGRATSTRPHRGATRSVRSPAGGGCTPALAARVRLLFDETKGDLRHEAEWEAVVGPLGTDVDGADFVAVDYDDRDLRPDPPDGRRLRPPRGEDPHQDLLHRRDSGRSRTICTATRR